MAGRETVLTEDAELLFGVTAVEPGGSAAALTLLLAPLAAPARRETVDRCQAPLKRPLHPQVMVMLTFLCFHVFPVTVGEVVLYSTLLDILSFFVVVVIVEPQLLVFIQRPGISAISTGGKTRMWRTERGGGKGTSASTDLPILWLWRSFSCSYRPFSPLNVCTYSMDSSAL